MLDPAMGPNGPGHLPDRAGTKLERRQRAGDISGCVVHGPLWFDMAFDVDAAVKKRRHDPAFGIADMLLFPNLLTASLTVKAIWVVRQATW